MQSSKNQIEVASLYDILGVKENANGLEIEDAFMEKIASPEYTVDPTNPSAVNEETLEKTLVLYEAYQTLTHPSKRIDYDVKLRMIRRGDDPDRPTEKRIKEGAFIKVEKEAKVKTQIDASQAADNLINESESSTANFMKTDFQHKADMRELSKKAQERQSQLGIDIKQLARHQRDTANTLGNIHKKSAVAYGTCGLIFAFVYFYQIRKRKSEKEEDALKTYEAK